MCVGGFIWGIGIWVEYSEAKDRQRQQGTLDWGHLISAQQNIWNPRLFHLNMHFQAIHKVYPSIWDMDHFVICHLSFGCLAFAYLPWLCLVALPIQALQTLMGSPVLHLTPNCRDLDHFTSGCRYLSWQCSHFDTLFTGLSICELWGGDSSHPTRLCSSTSQNLPETPVSFL